VSRIRGRRFAMAGVVAALVMSPPLAAAAAGKPPDPCSLVTVSQIDSIMGKTVSQAVDAPLGPTCIYKFKNSKTLVTIAVSPGRFAALVAQLPRHQRRRVSVRGYVGYCGKLGSPVLYVSLPRKRVLSIAAPCAPAQRLAGLAVRRI
jgi:hypothetical protein